MGNFTEEELNTVNDATALTLLPVIILLCIYMLLGLFGNPLVVMYYGYHVKPTHHFIVAMAIFDITVCCVSMPLEIVDLRFPYNFPSKTACKVLRSVNYFAFISSALVLVAIAIDRYRKVCQPFKKKISTQMTKIVIGIVCFISVCLSWPAFIFYDLHPVTNITDIPGAIGHDCTFTRKREYKIYIMAFIGVDFLVSIGCIVTLIVLYILIGRKLCRLYKFRFSSMTRKRHNGRETPPTSSTDVDIKLKRINVEHSGQQRIQTKIKLSNTNKTETLSKTTSMSCDRKLNELSCRQANNNGKIIVEEQEESILCITENKGDDQLSRTSSLESRNVHNTDGSDVDVKSQKTVLHTADSSARGIIKHQKKKHDRHIHLKKYTLLMFLITLVFIMSCLPNLGLLMWKTLAANHENYLLSNSELVTHNVFVRSWMISSVLNPLIYGFCNVEFRSFVSLYLRNW